MISVIIPAYNSADTIRACIESALNQTLKSFEIVIVDDGSNDETAIISKKFRGEVRYFYKENGGPASARNFGIRMSRSEYIAFLDSDDVWFPAKLEKQMKIFNKDTEVGLVYSDAYVAVGGKNNLKRRYFEDWKPAAGSVFRDLFQRTFIPTSSCIVRRKCFEDLGFFDEKKELVGTEDYEMWLRIASRFKLNYVDEPLILLWRRASSLSSDRIHNLQGTIDAINSVTHKCAEEIRNQKVSWRRRLSQLNYLKARYLMRSGKFSASVRGLREAILLDPLYVRPYAGLAALVINILGRRIDEREFIYGRTREERTK